MKKTQLYEQHLKLSARIVDFSGWALPLQYESIVKEHMVVREACGMFDCSHMGQVFISGDKAYEFVNYIICNNLDRINNGEAIYTGILNEQGGFLDDVIVYLIVNKHILIVVNASNVDKIVSWLEEKSTLYDVVVDNQSDNYGLLAIQGKQAKEKINSVLGEGFFDNLKSFHFTYEQGVQKNSSFIARTGYTGENGIEIIAKKDELNYFFEKFLSVDVVPCGLGARDSLRTEKAYSLYGQEIHETITPLEVNLSWIVDLNKNDFIGKQALLEQKSKGIDRKKLLFVAEGRPIARHNDIIINNQEEEVGVVSSGVVSPILKKGIGIALINSGENVDSLFVKTKRKTFPIQYIKNRDFLV